MNKADRHDWHSPEYVAEWVARSMTEDGRRQPRFRMMADLAPRPKDAPIDILDVGAGYGALSQAMLDAFPNARVVLQDYSALMLGHARQVLASYAGRAAFRQSDLFSADWTGGLGGPFDVAVSSICIYNLQSAPRIRQLYREIRGLLKEEGCFLNIDLVSAPNIELQGVYRAMMARQRGPGRQPIGAERALGRAEVEWPPFPATLDDQLAWLREAGFRNVDCFWKEGGLALVGGYR